MGENDWWGQPPPSGLLPNGLLPEEAASVIRPLDLERWSKAEERTAELIKCIKPNKPSEDRRTAVASYVQRLIMQCCYPCQVFTFGSVPLKTYLPDGDIDVTAFSDDQNLKETWAHQVRDILESEEKNKDAKFHVKEVQYIQAEVKIIKCLVENIVVDISFNQLGGLCTLCFLEEVDNLINKDHLFKRSIILIKAWCYYESRVLGAHHGLISTYALETLVLYIFHVFNNSFAGPLEVLYRFLEFFSKFDWDNFCVSLWGPVPISSLPDVAAEPPRKDGGDLLLSKLFLEACSAVYAVYPTGQESHGQPFVSKHFNVIDPLRVNNNLGRSVSKGNFFRIRSAFTFGARRLARLLDCPKEDIWFEVNQFFMNTWDRHGSGVRPDAPRNDLLHTGLSNVEHGLEKLRSNPSSKPSFREAQADKACGSHAVPSQHANHSLQSTFRSSEVASVSRTQHQKNDTNSHNTKTYNQSRREIGLNHGGHMEKGQRSSKLESLSADEGGNLSLGTHSSSELTYDYADVSYQGKHDRSSESGKGQSSARLDVTRRKNLDSDKMVSHSSRSSSDDPSSVRHTPSRQSLDAVADSFSVSNSYLDDSGSGVTGEEFTSSLETHGMHQEEQELMNMMAATTSLGFSGQVQIPLNLAPGQIPPSFSSSLLSMGYFRRNLGGMVPATIPLTDSQWGTNMQFPQGLVSPQLVHYFPREDLTTNPEDVTVLGDDNFGLVNASLGEVNRDFWQEQDKHSTGGFDIENGGLEMHQSDDMQPPTSTSYNFVHSSMLGGSATTSRGQQKSTTETRWSMREDHADTIPYQEDKDSNIYGVDRTASARLFTMYTSPLRSTTPESSWEGSSSKVSKLAREKRGRKASSALTPTEYRNSNSVSEYSLKEIDSDDKIWSQLPEVGHQMTESSMGLVERHQAPGFDIAQTSGSESLIPIAPVLVDPGAQQRTTDNLGVVPFAFYPTGPPVPFVTMLPLPMYNFPTETGTPEASGTKLRGEDGLDSGDFDQKFDASEGLDQSETLNTSNSKRSAASVDLMEQKTDILNSDFASHWQNLLYGRFCQNSKHPGPAIYQSPVMVPPVYLQGHFPMEAPGRRSTNMNFFTQLMSFGPHILPVTPMQSVPNRPTGMYKQHDDVPRYRGGTGTYLPTPKASLQDRPVNTRKGNYPNDRSDHHTDREGNWNVAKSRATGRSHNRSQPDRPSLRMDRLAASQNRVDRPWGSHKHDTYPTFRSQNGTVRLSSNGSTNLANGYPLPTMTPGGVSSNGAPVVMFYPYDHNTGYTSHPELLEFGSLGPVGLSGLNEMPHLSEEGQSAGGFDGHRFHRSLTQHSSPDQPSSPNFRR